ncbi:hypothetical protein PV325_011811 [Microctonus aethiopoides]|nr:hypothetical protein PV325_011811 [Microctonus aethiopoides]KAK0096976.1 hypothetical protein PV326_003741 [Microctonus aethiopoides]
MAGMTNEINQQMIIRRSSFALSLPANLVVDSARRRLSNVSDAVSRKISHTIGWRTVSSSNELIVRQGSALCGQYIRNRLKRSGIYQRKLGLKRMRSALMSNDLSVIDDVFPMLIHLSNELEKMHPNLFKRVARQVGCGHFSNEQTASDVITDIAREILRCGAMTWCKIVALYAVTGSVAIDCVRQGKAEFIPSIQCAMTEVLEEDLAMWIQANGGWSGLSTHCRTVEQDCAWQERGIVTLIICSTILICFISIILRILII